jgi:hypothetical protein
MFKQITRSIVIVVEALSADTLAKLLDTSKEGVDQTLRDLQFPSGDPRVKNILRLLRPSFRNLYSYRKHNTSGGKVVQGNIQSKGLIAISQNLHFMLLIELHLKFCLDS